MVDGQIGSGKSTLVASIFRVLKIMKLEFLLIELVNLINNRYFYCWFKYSLKMDPDDTTNTSVVRGYYSRKPGPLKGYFPMMTFGGLWKWFI